MAITKGYVLLPTLRDIFDTTGLAFDFDLETHLGALFTDSITIDPDADTAYGVAPFDANETEDAGNWPAGGVALTGTALTISSSVLKYDATDVSVASTTLTNAMGYLLYLVGGTNDGICLVDFVSAVSTIAGTIQITWNAAGIITFTT